MLVMINDVWDGAKIVYVHRNKYTRMTGTTVANDVRGARIHTAIYLEWPLCFACVCRMPHSLFDQPSLDQIGW
jgi:hypothetical protein